MRRRVTPSQDCCRFLTLELASRPLQRWTLNSRFVLYDDGTFALQYRISAGAPEYRGTYRTGNGAIAFEWEGWSTAGPWGASGTLDGKTLTVRFNLVMQMSDFEDAIYTLDEQSPATN